VNQKGGYEMNTLGGLLRKLRSALFYHPLIPIVVFLVVVSVIQIGLRDNEQTAPQSHAPTATATNADDWRAGIEAAEKNKTVDDPQSIRFQNSMAAAVQLRDSMRIPDSLILEEVWANEDGSVICFKYRAQNGFGGMNRGEAYTQNGMIQVDADAASYNRFCVGMSHNLTYSVNGALKIFEKW
jgi:hypothetical protein